MAKKLKTLKEIAVELLEKYEASETCCIWEYSGNIRQSEKLLKKEINKYRKTIEVADRKTENSSEKPNNCETCKWGEWYRKGYDITMMDDECGGRCSWRSKWTPKDEPQTCSVSGRPYSECADCEYFRCTADEPQKIMEKCYSCKWWNYSYGCSNKKGICEFEPLKDEPQTAKVIGCSKCSVRFWCTDRDMQHAVHCNNYGKSKDEQSGKE